MAQHFIVEVSTTYPHKFDDTFVHIYDRDGFIIGDVLSIEED